MKKTLSLILALTLAMALTVPATAAEVKSAKHTYTLSNEILGTTTFTYRETQYENGKVVLNEDGTPAYLEVEYTAYLVPVGTVVTNNGLFLSPTVYIYDKMTDRYDPEIKGSAKSLSIETIDSYGAIYNLDGRYSDIVYNVGTLGAEAQGEGRVAPAEDEGIYLKAVDPSKAPASGQAPAARPVVAPTNQKLTVNGEAKNAEIYNIDGSNYFKLRDMAALLNGTRSQFSVDFDSARNTIIIKTGTAYAPAGGELTTGTDKSASAVASAQSVEINGAKVELTAFNIGGNNFFKLRELGTALAFDVDYDNATATMIVKSK